MERRIASSPTCPQAAERTTLPAVTVAASIPLGGTRFIGVYLARQLIEQGHEVTLLTRGKKPVTYRIPDDTGAGQISHLAAACTRHAALTLAAPVPVP